MSLLAHRLVSTPLRGTTSSLTHRLVSDSDTICNSPDPPIVDIVLFGFSFSDFLSSFLKPFPKKRFSHPYKGVSFYSPTNLGSHNPPPLQGPASSLALIPFSNRCGTLTKFAPFWDLVSLLAHKQPPRRHIARCLALIPFVTAQTHHTTYSRL